MSMLLMVKAMQCKVGNATRKLVLLKLADNASDDGVCFPSYQHIADQCEISRRSAISHIDALIEMGWVEKKERKTKEGNTSNLYILRLEQGGENTVSSSENISPRTSHSINQSINHKKTTQKKSTALTLLAQFGITEQLAEDFITHRKAKTAPITKTALERLQKQADLAGLPLAEVAEIMIERGWRGFKASWDWQETPQNRSKKSKFDDNDDSWWRGKTIEVRGF